MKSKEIIFVSNFLGNGGAARVISVLAKELVENGYDVTVCSYPFGKVQEGYDLGRAKHIQFKMTRERGALYKFERIIKLRREIKKHPNATVVSFEYFMNMQTIVALFGLKNRLIVSERNDPARVGGQFSIKYLRNILYMFTDCLVCQTQDALEYFPQVIQKKSVIIMNPIKDNLINPWTGKAEKEIVNFCRLEKQKNLGLLIDAFSIFYSTNADYRLSIFGDGKERVEILQYIKQKGLEKVVSVYPAINDIHDRVYKSMMFVSSSDYEGLSNSMIEAMAIGLPTICTDCPCGGARMIIENGVNGILVPVRNVDALACAMDMVANDEELRMRLKYEGSKVKMKLSTKEIMKEWERIL